MAIFGRAFPIRPWIGRSLTTGGVSPNVNLAAVAATGAVAGFTPQISIAAGAAAATGAVGVFTPSVATSLGSGVGAGAAADFAAVIALVMDGVAGIGDVAALTSALDIALDAAAASGGVGDFTAVVGILVPLVTTAATGDVADFAADLQATLLAATASGVAGDFNWQNATPLVGTSAVGAAADLASEIQIPLSAVIAAGAVGPFGFQIDSAPALSSVAALGAVEDFIVRITGLLDITRRFLLLAPQTQYVGLADRQLFVVKAPYSIGGSMPPLANLPAIGPHQVQTMAIDFGNFLPSGVTLSGTPILTLRISLGVDSDPNSRLLNGPNIGTASVAIGGTGLTNAAIIFQIGTCIQGTNYVLDTYCDRSDGDVVEASTRFSCVAPS